MSCKWDESDDYGSDCSPKSGLAWPGLALIMFSACSDSPEGPAANEAIPPRRIVDRETGSAQGTSDEHDFGLVLGQGQTLQHEFRIANSSGLPLKLLKVVALRPCCSSVGLLPDQVPPGGEVGLVTSLRLGRQTGRKRVGFVVRTDSPERPAIALALGADVVSAFEVHEQDHPDQGLLTGQPARLRLEVVCRRLGQEGSGAPVAIRTEGPLAAEFAGAAVERARPGGLVETTREAVVVLPAMAEPGPKRGEVRFGWPDGQEQRHLISWEVSPRLVASPSALVVRASEGRATKTIVLRAVERPFRIREVSAPTAVTLAEPVSTDAARLHRVRLEIDPSRLDSGSAEVRVETDDPDQPTVVLSLLAIPDDTEVGRWRAETPSLSGPRPGSP